MTPAKKNPKEDPDYVDPELRDRIDHALHFLRGSLYEIAFTDDAPVTRGKSNELHDELTVALRAADGARNRRLALKGIEESTATALTFGEIAARSVKLLRERSGFTQEELAECMVRLGFVTWKRITVAESESGKRKLSIEEMVGMAVLFDVPVAYLLSAFEDNEALRLNEGRVLTRAQAQELVTGENRTAWHGIRLNPTAAGKFVAESTAAGEKEWRPVDAGTLRDSTVSEPRMGYVVRRDRDGRVVRRDRHGRGAGQ